MDIGIGHLMGKQNLKKVMLLVYIMVHQVTCIQIMTTNLWTLTRQWCEMHLGIVKLQTDPPVNEPPNPEAQKFYDMLDAAQRPIWPDSRMTELEAAVRLMSIKSNYNVSHNCFDEFAGLMKEACPDENSLPSNFFEVKKIVGKLGLTAEKIDCCPNGCMLYYKDDLGLRDCKFYHQP